MGSKVYPPMAAPKATKVQRFKGCILITIRHL